MRLFEHKPERVTLTRLESTIRAPIQKYLKEQARKSAKPTRPACHLRQVVELMKSRNLLQDPLVEKFFLENKLDDPDLSKADRNYIYRRMDKIQPLLDKI
jgi:hypothetical protein